MNTSQNSQNPYVAGPPVSGKNFYGRSKELGDVLDGAKKFIWFISTRRMGKTSLLRQIAYLCQHEPKYNDQYRCLFWDLQGISEPNSEKLRKRLTLRINQQYIPEVDFSSLDSNQSCAQVIESCIEVVSQKGLILLLLIDETDAFLDLVEKGGTDFLDELLDCLQLQGIRTVITSTYKPYQLASKHSLFDRYFVPLHIDTFNREEGKALISMANIYDQPPPFARDEQVIDEILDKANYSPFFIQTMCYYLYPDNDITDEQIWDAISVLELIRYFESDFSGLNDAEKAILCFMIDEEEKDLPASEIITGAKEIMPKGIKIIPTQRSLDVMTSLNILRHKNDNYYIGNNLNGKTNNAEQNQKDRGRNISSNGTS
jgi:hypothetical protein